MKIFLCWIVLLAFSLSAYSQVDTSFVYNTSTPFGTLDIRIRKSASRFYYLQPDKTVSVRESSPGVKSNTYRDMTSWDSKLYTEGNLREKNGTQDYFILNYRLLFPNNYNTTYNPGYPLIIMMHGAGERGNCWDTKCYHATRTWNVQANEPPAPTTATHQLLNNDHNLLHGGKVHLDARNAAGTRLPNDPSMPSRSFPGFVLFPQNMNGWTSGTVQDAIRLVRLVVQKYNIDPDKIFIHGLSNGGYATYEAIKRAPWLFAAALPMSAVSDGGITTQNMATKVAHIPLWIFQGGIDTSPNPGKTEGYVKKLREAGAVVRYSKYSNLGHGVWNTAYREPDFFSWMRKQTKSKIHVFADNPKICQSNGMGVRMALAEGFRKYQWERNGVIIAGATSATYEATTAGSYRARFSRVANPTEAQWNEWSEAVSVTTQNPAKAIIDQVGTVVLKDLNGFADAKLVARGDYAHYYWYKNGGALDMPGTVEDTLQYATIKPISGNGNYTLVVAGYDNCPSPPSDAKTIFFNDSAPINLAAPTNFTGVSQAGYSVRLAWAHTAAGELGFEIWRRKATGGTFKWEMATLTGVNVTGYTDTGLEPSTTYQYKIRAVGKTGRSNYTPSSATQYLVVTTGGDNIAPTIPASVTASQTGINTITVKWNASTDNSGIREYVIYYGTTSVATGSAVTTYKLSNLAVNKDYTFTVKAKDLSGNLSGVSNSATANTVVTGLYYEHSTGSYSNLDAINWNIVEFSGKVNNFTLAPRTQEDYFNFRFDGYLYITTGGTYEFSTISSDGSRVEINGVTVVDNNGIHGNRTVVGPAQSLTAGAKRIQVKYFELDGTHSLTVRYKGPDTGGLWKNIPDAALRSSNAVAGASTEEVIVVENPETLEEPVSVYPNPTDQHNIHVQVKDAEEGEVRINMTDMRGAAMYHGNFGAAQVREGVRVEPNQTLITGMYVIVVYEKNRTTRKLISIR